MVLKGNIPFKKEKFNVSAVCRLEEVDFAAPAVCDSFELTGWFLIIQALSTL